ncbi:hypothetical protein BS78_02G217100 [Paspalum vaginatum]|nr:hypothetical protein BS78_02G217100 [Paspalum vaginatum]
MDRDLGAAVYTEPYDQQGESKSGHERRRSRHGLLLRERQRMARRGGGLGHHRGRGRRRRRRRTRAAVEIEAGACVHGAHDHPLPCLAARRRGADEVEEPGAGEREPGVAAAGGREPAHRARRAAPVVIARAHQEDRVARVLEIWTWAQAVASYYNSPRMSPTLKRCLVSHTSGFRAPPSAHPVPSPTPYTAGGGDDDSGAAATKTRRRRRAQKATAKQRRAIDRSSARDLAVANWGFAGVLTTRSCAGM